MNIFIAGETSIQLRADEFENTVQIISGLLVGVLDLTQNLLVVVNHVGTGNDNAVPADLGHDAKLRHHVVGQSEGFVVRVQRWVHGDGARVEFLLDHSHGLSLLPLLVVVLVSRHGDVNVGEDTNPQPEVLVFTSNVAGAVDLDGWLLWLQNLKF